MGQEGFSATGNETGPVNVETQVTAPAVARGEPSRSEQGGDCRLGAKTHFKSCEGCYRAGCEGRARDRAGISRGSALIA